MKQTTQQRIILKVNSHKKYGLIRHFCSMLGNVLMKRFSCCFEGLMFIRGPPPRVECVIIHPSTDPKRFNLRPVYVAEITENQPNSSHYWNTYYINNTQQHSNLNWLPRSPSLGRPVFLLISTCPGCSQGCQFLPNKHQNTTFHVDRKNLWELIPLYPEHRLTMCMSVASGHGFKNFPDAWIAPNEIAHILSSYFFF